MRTSFTIGAAVSGALLLSSCGKQEPVEDVPSSEELAQEADAASKAIREQAEGADAPAVDTSQMASYTNALRGFTLLVPKDWTVDEAASDDNGSMFTDPEAGIALNAAWTENREDADLLAAVKTLEEAGDVTGNYVNEDEYRASGTIGDGKKTAERILRKPDGTMVRAAITYPLAQAETLDPLVAQVLDSLTLR